ncbi:MAG: hypothetical protein WDZ35_02850 [Crocinitomicaceae bacterium]
MKKNVKTMMLITASVLMVGMTSCKKEGCTDPTANNYSEEAKKDDGTCTYDEIDESVVQVSSNITSNTTWTSDKVYVLGTRVAVESGATLTIEPGTIIKGEAGTGSNATALIIARGGKLMAEGTATKPIIFTSIADEIQPGQIASPNLSTDLDGLWGGLIILGNANISADAPSVQIEGIPVSDQNGLYGGTDDTDNSGTIRYVSIRHGGANIGEGNEINGLTLGAVGSGTTIDHIEVIANQDDGIEFFGGTVNVSHAVLWNIGDDAIDTDQAWNGTLNNFFIVTPGDECFELDGPEGAYINGNFTLTNGSIKAGGTDGLIDNDANTNVDMSNIYFFDLSLGQDFDEMPTVTTNFSAIEAVIPTGDAVTDYFKDGSDAFTTNVAQGAQTVGATKSEFSGWSWTDITGGLDDF